MIHAAGITISAHGGRKKVNQDTILVQDGLYAVIDGVSAADSAAFGARLARRRLARYCGTDPPSAFGMQHALSLTDGDVRAYLHARPDLGTANCVLTALWIHMRGPQEGRYIVGHVGDTAGFHIRAHADPDNMVPQTPSHTDPDSGALTKTIGSLRRGLEGAYLGTGQLAPGEQYLLVSDGFESAVFNAGWQTILEVIRRPIPVTHRVAVLLDLARLDVWSKPATLDGNWDDTSIILVERT